jgi:hypothetical protein
MTCTPAGVEAVVAAAGHEWVEAAVLAWGAGCREAALVLQWVVAVVMPAELLR